VSACSLFGHLMLVKPCLDPRSGSVSDGGRELVTCPILPPAHSANQFFSRCATVVFTSPVNFASTVGVWHLTGPIMDCADPMCGEDD
jgi:hypothetical protein